MAVFVPFFWEMEIKLSFPRSEAFGRKLGKLAHIFLSWEPFTLSTK